MLTSSPDLSQKSLQIKQDDKFFSRLLSRENSVANSSFRVYYAGASVAIPFMWESQPGTPKNKFSDTSLPPLTPPPSYLFNSKKKPIKNYPKSKPSALLQSLFPKRNLKKTHASSSPSPPPSSSSWSSSYNPLNSSKYQGRNQFSSARSSFDSRADEEYPAFGSPASTLCFGVRHETASGFKGCYPMVAMKNALLGIVRHGSS